MYVDFGLSQEMESPKGKAKLSKPLEPQVYLVLPFFFNSFRCDAEINLFAFLLISNTLGSIWIQEHSSSNLDDRQASKAVLYHLEIFVWKPNEFVRFARTFYRNIGTFSANLSKLFPNLFIRHWKVGQETSKLGGGGVTHEPFWL